MQLASRHPQAQRRSGQALVQRPQGGPWRQACAGQQMRIDVADADPVQRVGGDEAEHFASAGHVRLRQVLHRIQHGVALLQAAQGQLTQHEGVRQHLRTVEQPGQLVVARLQMRHLYGGVDRRGPDGRTVPDRRRGWPGES